MTATPRWTHSIQAFVSSSGGSSLAVAERPVRAAEPGVRGAHDDPDRDEGERGQRGSRRARRLEAGHETRHSSPAAARFRPGAATLSGMSRTRSLALPARPRPGHRRVRGHRPRRRPARRVRVGASTDALCDRHGARVARRLGGAGPGPVGLPEPHHEPDRLRPVADPLLVPRQGQRPGRSARTGPLKVAFYDLAKDPTTPVTTVDGDVRRGRSRASAACTSSTSTCPRPAPGASSSRPRRRAARRRRSA